MTKLKNKKTLELEHNLTNMLIHLYNGKQCSEYIKEYKTILDSLIWTKKNFGLQSNELLIKFRNKIYDIVAQVRDKINKDAKDQGLISTVLKESQVPQ
jgi:hypothetical protein